MIAGVKKLGGRHTFGQDNKISENDRFGVVDPADKWALIFLKTGCVDRDRTVVPVVCGPSRKQFEDIKIRIVGIGQWVAVVKRALLGACERPVPDNHIIVSVSETDRGNEGDRVDVDKATRCVPPALIRRCRRIVPPIGRNQDRLFESEPFVHRIRTTAGKAGSTDTRIETILNRVSVKIFALDLIAEGPSVMSHLPNKAECSREWSRIGGAGGIIPRTGHQTEGKGVGNGT